MSSSVKRSERFLLALGAALPSLLTVAILTWGQNPQLRPGIIGYTALGVGLSIVFAEV